MKILIFIAAAVLFSVSAFAGSDIFGRPFSDGSPPCTACHSVAAAGYTAAAWGPDISSLYSDMGGDAASIAEFVKNSGIGPMDAVYAKSKITEAEIQALAEAFAKLNTENAAVTGGWKIAVYALLLFAAFIAAVRLVFGKNRRLEENK